MRRIFISTISLDKIEDNYNFVSEDFDLDDGVCKFAWPKLLDQYVDAGDEVVVATIVQNTQANCNYQLYKEEMERALAAQEAKVSFEVINIDKDFHSRSLHTAFKAMADIIRDEDQVYLDVGCGPLPFAFSNFVACYYAIKTNCNAEMDRIVCGVKEKKQIKLYDMTSMFFLNQMAGTLNPEDKDHADGMLEMIFNY